MGFDAVGLRIRQGEDCPYYEQNGFRMNFCRRRISCAQKRDEPIVRDAAGQAVLECTCGLVLSGRTDPSMPCFTEGGSFWTNVSSELLALTPEVDPRTNPRNRCIHAGLSIGRSVPVRSGDEIIGLLQLNDRREGRFTPELDPFLRRACRQHRPRPQTQAGRRISSSERGEIPRTLQRNEGRLCASRDYLRRERPPH